MGDTKNNLTQQSTKRKPKSKTKILHTYKSPDTSKKFRIVEVDFGYQLEECISDDFFDYVVEKHR